MKISIHRRDRRGRRANIKFYKERKGLFLYVLCFLCGAILLSCGKPPEKSDGAGVVYDPKTDPLVNPPSLFEPPPSDRSKISFDETLNFHLKGSPNTLSPIFTSSLYDSTVVGTLNDALFTWGKDLQIRVNEEVVESFDESEDHTTFILRLRPNLKWHDGHPFTAHDIVYSWQQILDERVPALTFKSGTDEIKECVALDDRTVRFVQPEPLATRLWNLVYPIIPRHIFEKHKQEFPDLKTGTYYNNFARAPVGWGPYRFVDWRDQERIVVERWEEYHGKKPYLKRIVFRIIPDDHVALLSFEKGTVDVVEPVTPQQFAIETTRSDSFKRVGVKGWGPEWSYRHIGWNMDGSNPFFNDRRVRHAMAHAFNLPLIIDKIFFNLETPCHGIFHPDAWMYNPQVKILEYDLDRAAALLEEAGWNLAPDGWRYKEIDGRRIPFQFTLLLPQGRDFYPKVAAIFQADLRKLGVRMDTRLMEWSAFMEKAQKHEFQATMAAWGTGTDPDTNWNLWRTEEYKTGRNYGGYSNPEVDRLFELGRREFDREKRAAIYQQIHKLIYDDQPSIFISNIPTLAVINKRVRGVQFSPRGLTGFDPAVFAWWVPTGAGAPVAAY